MQVIRKQFFLFLILIFTLVCNSQNPNILWEACYGGVEWDEGYSIIKNKEGYLVYGSTESSDGDIEGHHGLSDAWLIQIDSIGNLLWTKSYGGTKGEYGEEILVGDYNEYYLVGLSGSEDGDISHDPYPNSMDYWVIKIDSVGEIIWDKILGGTAIDWTRNAVITNDGGVIALGISTSDNGDVTNYHGDWDIWMVKLNSEGTKQWDFSLGGIGSEEGASVKQTSDGGFIVVGDTDGRGGGNFDTACNHHMVGFYDVWVVKLDSLRNIQWQQCYGGTFNEGGNNIIETTDGYFVLGSTFSNDGDVSGLNGPPGPNSEYGGDIWVFKIDKQGNLLWQNCLGGSYDDFARNIFTTSDGGFMVVGTTASDDGDVEGYHGIDTGIYDDIWFAKLDSLGQLTWQYCYGGGGRETLYRGVVQKSDFNYVITLGTDTDEWQCGMGGMWPDLRVVELGDTLTSINDQYLAQGNFYVNASPNPANEIINFEYSLPAGYSTGRIELFNANGIVEKVFIISNSSDKISYYCSNLVSGIYFYRLVTGDITLTDKLIINR